ncbi:MAG TPA: tetratricopeptide repeat protein [bacterium]|nr:tetratricopeptide repeat protein [bacterium]
MPLSLSRCTRLAAIALILLAAFALRASQPDTALLRQGVEWGVTHDYERALELFDRITREFPERPEGPFFRAAIYQSMMLDFESGEWRDNFDRCIESAIRLAKHQLRAAPTDPEAQFYAGAAYAYKSAQLSRDGKYWPAYRAIQSALDYLEPLLAQDSSFCDARLGIGTWQYWRSRVTVHFSWLPFFPDRRREGIANIVRAGACTRLSPASAWSNLTWIYIREKEYDRAIAWAELGLEHYPGSRFFLWPLAEARFLKADWSAARDSYMALLGSTRAATPNNGYNELVILWKIAQCHDRLGNVAQAAACYRQLLACPVGDEVARRAADKKKKAAEWLQAHAGNPRQAE